MAHRQQETKPNLHLSLVFIQPTGLTNMILGTPTKLASQFRLTYNMILSLLRVEALKIEDMIKRSFSENLTQKLLPDQEMKLQETSKKMDALTKLDCVICVPNIYDYYEACMRYLYLTFEMKSKIMCSPQGIKSLSVGRVVMVNNIYYRNVIGVIVQSGTSSLSKTSSYLNKEDVTKTYEILILYDKNQVNAKLNESSVPLPPTRINLPTREDMISQSIQVPITDILFIFSSSLKFKAVADEERVILSQLYDMATQVNATQDLDELDWSKLRELEFQEKYQERHSLFEYMRTFQCNQCPDFVHHVSSIFFLGTCRFC